MSSANVAAVVAGLVALGLAGGAAAGPSVKPGLWEMTIKSKMSGGNLPPGMGENTMTIKFCVTPENATAAWEDMAKTMDMGEDGECAISDMKEANGTYSFSTKCTSGMSGTMTGKITPTSMEQSGDMAFADKTMNMKMSFTNLGKWVGPTCPAGTPGAPEKASR
ncbi:DUF3617 domain-containing protein [Pedomonas mirosovicensis]|uniref:DUF3617 domain-containing protein n=1 Tax=Pedomonas mirosovicensis TaxID=2908641 RepID=UPI002169F24A|nr:DUF3617 domain-containing protein [Pedomonas mirosovicensis]MCH8685321.1 DUF3617 domain-containing protein [Pedomonas mirosovicensis]